MEFQTIICYKVIACSSLSLDPTKHPRMGDIPYCIWDTDILHLLRFDPGYSCHRPWLRSNHDARRADYKRGPVPHRRCCLQHYHWRRVLHSQHDTAGVKECCGPNLGRGLCFWGVILALECVFCFRGVILALECVFCFRARSLPRFLRIQSNSR